jgi:hypothetical protein
VPRRGAAAARLAGIHVRRHLDAERAGRRLAFDRGLAVPAALGSALATGAIDAERVVRLAGGLSLFDYGAVRAASRTGIGAEVDPTFGLLVLAWTGVLDVELEPRPGWAARLAAGRVDTVVREAVLRLRMAELPPLVEAEDLSVASPPGTALAAALLLRTTRLDRRRLASTLIAVEAGSPTEGATT